MPHSSKDNSYKAKMMSVSGDILFKGKEHKNTKNLFRLSGNLMFYDTEGLRDLRYLDEVRGYINWGYGKSGKMYFSLEDFKRDFYALGDCDWTSEICNRQAGV